MPRHVLQGRGRGSMHSAVHPTCTALCIQLCRMQVARQTTLRIASCISPPRAPRCRGCWAQCPAACKSHSACPAHTCAHALCARNTHTSAL